MRTETIKIFEFSELSENAKETAIENVRPSIEFTWMDEYHCSLKAFCDALGISVPFWESDAWMRFRYIPHRSHWQERIRGRSLSDFDRDAMPTGYFADAVLFNTFVTQWEKHSDPVLAIEQAFNAFFHTLEEDYTHCFSDDGVVEFIEANDIAFTEEGKVWEY